MVSLNEASRIVMDLNGLDSRVIIQRFNLQEPKNPAEVFDSPGFKNVPVKTTLEVSPASSDFIEFFTKVVYF